MIIYVTLTIWCLILKILFILYAMNKLTKNVENLPNSHTY